MEMLSLLGDISLVDKYLCATVANLRCLCWSSIKGVWCCEIKSYFILKLEDTIRLRSIQRFTASYF